MIIAKSFKTLNVVVVISFRCIISDGDWVMNYYFEPIAWFHVLFYPQVRFQIAMVNLRTNRWIKISYYKLLLAPLQRFSPLSVTSLTYVYLYYNPSRTKLTLNIFKFDVSFRILDVFKLLAGAFVLCRIYYKMTVFKVIWIFLESVPLRCRVSWLTCSSLSNVYCHFNRSLCGDIDYLREFFKRNYCLLHVVLHAS